MDENATKTGYDALPQAVKDLYYSNEMLAAVQSVGTKYRLHFDQIGILEQEVGAVMLGHVASSDFVPDLMKHLGVDRITAAGIAQDINDLLFSKIRDSLRQKVESADTEPRPQALVEEKLPAAPIAHAPNPLTSISISKEKIVDTSIAPQKNEYRADPYREPVD